MDKITNCDFNVNIPMRLWTDATKSMEYTFGGLKDRITTGKEVRNVISRQVFLEALGDVDVSKKVRRKVKELESSDFEYLVALMLAQAFDPNMLDEFEREPERVIVVEE